MYKTKDTGEQKRNSGHGNTTEDELHTGISSPRDYGLLAPNLHSTFSFLTTLSSYLHLHSVQFIHTLLCPETSQLPFGVNLNTASKMATLTPKFEINLALVYSHNILCLPLSFIFITMNQDYFVFLLIYQI